VAPRQGVEVVATAEDGSATRFGAIVRIDGEAEVEYFRNGGILQTVLRDLLDGRGR
jgi:aconitate hydratase